MARAGGTPGGVPRFLAQASAPIPPGTFLPPVTGAVGGAVAANTALLVHGDGINGSTGFTDSSSYAHTLTAASTAQVSTSVQKFGSGSINLTADPNAVIDTRNSSDFHFGGGQFTIDAWVYYTSAPGTTFNPIICQWGGGGAEWWFGINSSGHLMLLGTTDGSSAYFSAEAAFTPTLNTWYHLAVDRDASNNIRLYVNGAVILTVNQGSVYYPSTTNCLIGNQPASSLAGLCYIDEVRVSVGVARYAGAFTPPTAPYSSPIAQDSQTISAACSVIQAIIGTVGGSDPNTVLLLHADGVNGSTSFIDTSSYAHTLTAVGTAQVTTANPKFGTGNLICNPSANSGIDTNNTVDFQLGSGPFTIETWFLFTGSLSTGSYKAMATSWGAGGLGYAWWFGIDNNNIITFFWSPDGSNGSVSSLTFNQSFAASTWYHLAVERDASNVIRLYVNGAVVNSTTSAITIYPSVVSAMVGTDHDGNYFQGQLDEVRISRGVARYGGAFAPPGAPFTIPIPVVQANQTLSAAGVTYPPITGGTGTPPIPSPSCVLLLHADGTAGSTTFIDASPSAHTLTPTSATVNATAKFGSGSANFTASTASRIDTGNATDFNFGAGPFTVEAWAYVTGVVTSPTIAGQFNWSGSNEGWAFWADPSNLYFEYTLNGTTRLALSAAYALPSSTWVHLAIDRDAGNNLRFYANGSVLATASLTGTIYPSTLNCIIGNDNSATDRFPGYLDEVRVTKGRAMYAGAFTPPVFPFSVSNTVLLLHTDSVDGSGHWIDSSLNANTVVSAGPVTLNTTTKQFGIGSADFSGGTTRLMSPGPPGTDFNFGAGPFTIEAWCYFTSAPSLQMIASQINFTSFANSGWAFYVSSGGTLRFLYSTTGLDSWAFAQTFTPTLNTWYHLAIDRDATNTVRLYVNGTAGSTNSGVTDTIYPSTLNLIIGNDSSLSYNLSGYIDEVRITKGIARFAGNFTPPTTAYLPDFTVGITQADQTLSAAGTVGAAGAITGTLAVTQADQTVSATGTVLVTGTLNQTQAAQTLAATGTVGVSGTLAATQANHTLAATGTVGVGATLGITQADQTLAAAGTVLVRGTLSITQADQTLAATGSVVAGISCTLNITQDNHTLAATGTVTAGASLNQTQANQTLAATATVLVGATLARTQDNHTLNASGTGTVAGTLNLTQAPQTLVADGTAGFVATTGSLNLAQDWQTLLAAGAVSIIATLSRTQDPQTLTASGNTGGTTCALSVLQADQTLAATAYVANVNTATLSITQANHTLVAAGTVGIGATLAVTQANQTLAATGTTSIVGTLALTQQAQALTSTGTVAIVGNLNFTQDNQRLAATGFVVEGYTATLVITQAPQTLVAAGTVLVEGRLNLLERSDILTVGRVSVGNTATLSRNQDDQTLNATGISAAPTGVQSRVMVMA